MYEEIMTNDDNLESNLLTSSLLKICSLLQVLLQVERECYIVGLGLDCKFIDLLFKRSINIFIKISLYLNFIVLEIVSKQTDTLIQELMYLR